MPILPTAYLPSFTWFAAFWNDPDAAVEQQENYQKGSLRNRAYLAGPNGIHRISIPLLKGKHQQTPIRDVRISYQEPWQRLHWRTIRTAYGNAPYFEHYAPELERFYTAQFEFLFDYNLEILKYILQKFGRQGYEIKTGHGFPAEQQIWVTPPITHHQPPTSNLQNPTSNIRYPQVFENKHGFLPGLSVLDLLFCCGKRGAEVLVKAAVTANPV